MNFNRIQYSNISKFSTFSYFILQKRKVLVGLVINEQPAAHKVSI